MKKLGVWFNPTAESYVKCAAQQHDDETTVAPPPPQIPMMRSPAWEWAMKMRCMMAPHHHLPCIQQ